MSTKFDDFLNEQLNDAEIRSEYEALQAEHDLIQDMIDGKELHKVISAK
jgi:XRE family transcriptional regulator